MKILFATSSFRGGGITSYAKEVISYYSQGNDFSVMIGDDSVSPIKTPNVKIYRYECRDLSVKNAKAVIDIINNEIKPEVILSNNARIISLVSKYLNDEIKVITISHSIRYQEADMAAISYHYIDKLIAASSIYNKKYLEKRFHVDGNKIDIILNFVAEVDYANVLREKKKSRKPDEPCLIVFPGGASSSKSPDIVLRVVLELVKTNLNFRIVWNGRTEITSKKLSFLHVENIKDFVNDPRVEFPGRLPAREDAVRLISSANIFLAPSRREACPMALLEAMRVGTIPLVSDFDVANKLIVKDGVNGYVIAHDDIDSWVRRIKDIVENPSKYNDIYDNSYKTFLEDHSYSVWRNNMDKALYGCSLNHLERKRLSVIDLVLRKIYFSFDLLRCTIEMRFNEGVKVVYAFMKIKRQYRIKS